MADDPPRTVPFNRGRQIVLTHYEYEDHEEVTAQWSEKHPEDSGELWLGVGATLRDACLNAVNEMLSDRP